MEKIIQGWLSIWLYVMAGIGILLAICIWKNRKKWDKVSILCTLAIIVLILHVLEEWALPGGLHYSYNISHGSTLLSKYPMNRLTDMITNFGAVVVGCIVLKVWGFRKPTAIAVLCFLLINLPEMVLGDENTPYEFTNRGYYEQFGEQFEEDYGYEYFKPNSADENK